MSTDVLVVYCTVPATGVAGELAESLVSDGLAACVNLSGEMDSFFAWQGKLDHDRERLMIIKTSRQAYPALEAALRERHPYELPEIIAMPVERGLAGYLQWVTECTKTA